MEPNNQLPNQPPQSPPPPEQPSQSTVPAPTGPVVGGPGQAYPTGNMPNPAPTTASSSKLPLLVGAAVIVIFLIGASFLLLHKSNKNSSQPKSSNNPVSKLTGQKDIVDRSDGKLDLSQLVDQTKTIKNQTLNAKINQQVNVSDGFSFMLTKVEPNFTSPNQFDKPDAGKQFIALHVVGGNRQKSGTLFFSADSLLKLKNSKGGLEDSEFAAAYPNDQSSSADLQPGDQKEAVVVFQTDPNEKPLTLVYQQKYDKFGVSNKTETVTVTANITAQ